MVKSKKEKEKNRRKVKFIRRYIVFVSKDHYNPLGIVRTLGEAHIKPIVVVVKGEPKLVSKSRYVKIKHFVDSPEDGLKLILSKYAVSKTEKSFILTGDDVTVSLLDMHYNELKDYFYFYNAGENGRIRQFMNKDVLNHLALKHGFNVPRTWKVSPGEIPEDLEYPIITKATHSFGAEWKNIVFICRNEEDLCEAFKKIKSEKILLQQYIEKTDEQSYEGFSVNHGKNVFFSVQNNEVYHLKDKYAPFWRNKNVHDKSFTAKVSRMLAEIGFEGIFEFEFIVGADKKLYFLEINFRNTANGWTTTVAGMPSATLWCASMFEGKIVNGCYKEIPDGFTTMAECFDYDVRVKTGRISRREWMKQYKKANAKLYRGRKDIRPFFSFLWYKYTKMRVEKKYGKGKGERIMELIIILFLGGWIFIGGYLSYRNIRKEYRGDETK